ncbi:MAG: hypothetical protein ABIQ73_04350 [Acidimicrobiales bacterium]
MDEYVEVDEQEGGGLAVKASHTSGRDPALCMSPSAPDAHATQPHRLGSDDE